MLSLPSRQVHLDFHTSEHIPGVGAKFDRKQFQQALKAGRLNSITLFAKCHHGWSYYPTSIGKMHPTLKRNLLAEQIAAAHAVGVRAPIYYTVGWSANDAVKFPECTRRDKAGKPDGLDLKAKPTDKRPICSWVGLLPMGRYLKLMLDQTREICEQFEVDGFFYDICFGPLGFGKTIMAEMRRAGLNPAKDEDVTKFHRQIWQNFMNQCRKIILARHPQATIFFNGGADPYHPEWHYGQTHFELEDLPTTWGGYDKLPLRAKYFVHSGKQYMAMSGKFHTMWGEFGGFKHPDAIRFEASAMIAQGARCSFGDQLHPSGAMDMATYRNIGAGYRYVEQIEEYGLNGRPCADLGLWTCGQEDHDQGVANILLENQLVFDIVQPAEDFSKFKTIILSGGAFLKTEEAERLTAYVRGGGAVVALYESLLDSSKKRFVLPVGAKYIGGARYDSDYLVAGKKLVSGLVASPVLCYTAALRAKPGKCEVLADIKEPYFSRTYAKYCSHQNTPNRLDFADHPAAWRQGRFVCLAHPLGEMYYKHGARLHRDYFINALRLVYDKPVIETALPSSGRINLLHQPQRRRYVAHLLYSPPLQRGRCLVIEDFVPLLNVPLTLRVPERITNVRLAPQNSQLKFKRSGGGYTVTVPKLQGHQIVVFEYGKMKA